MKLDSSSIDSACWRIRDHINAPMKQHQLMEAGRPWLQICSSLDVIEDTQLAISAYRELDLVHSDHGFHYLTAYGLLQALVIQQDAVRNLTEHLGTAYNPTTNTALRQVRNVRNSIAGHPSKEDRSGPTSHNFLMRMTLHVGVLTYERARLDGDSERASIKPLELIEIQEMELSRCLLELSNDLDEEQQRHIEAHRGTRVDIHLEGLGYYFEKMSQHAVGSGELGNIGLLTVAAAIDTFKNAITDRDGDLEAFEYLVLELTQVDFCIQQLEGYFSGDGSGEIVSSAMAVVVVSHLKQTVDKLVLIGTEMDQTYNQEKIERMES